MLTVGITIEAVAEYCTCKYNNLVDLLPYSHIVNLTCGQITCITPWWWVGAKHCFVGYSLLTAGSAPTLAEVFRLYCSLEAGLTVRDLCMRHDLQTVGVNER